METDTLTFARRHVADDTARLLLGAARYQGIDMPLAVRQIEGLRTAQTKWPALAAAQGVLFPPRVNCEQASSEATAAYKATLLLRALQADGAPATVADLTGGMGVDAMAMARLATHVHYVERDPALCQLAQRNFAALGLGNISVHCADGLEWLQAWPEPLGAVYADPSRRDAGGHRLVALEHCSPDVVQAWPLLSAKAARVLVKASPMVHLERAMTQLAPLEQVHVVALEGECKEVLLLSGAAPEPQVTCVNLRRSGAEEFVFTPSAEREAQPLFASHLELYIYEPNAAVMKAGAFALAAARYGLAKLDRNTHLYTSAELRADFAGRIFQLHSMVPLSRKALQPVLPDGRVNVICRNYPQSAPELCRRLKLADGGDLCLIATTLAGRCVGLICHIVKGLA